MELTACGAGTDFEIFSSRDGVGVKDLAASGEEMGLMLLAIADVDGGSCVAPGVMTWNGVR